MLLFLEKVYLGWKHCRVIEYNNLPRCFKCCGFNHYAKECKGQLTCFKCGGSHNGKECKSEKSECVNCVKKYNKLKDKSDFDIESLKHNAYSKNCPVYVALIEKQKKRESETQ